jgi:hypothetical protein
MTVRQHFDSAQSWPRHSKEEFAQRGNKIQANLGKGQRVRLQSLKSTEPVVEAIIFSVLEI